MDKNIGKAIQRAVQSKKYIKRIQLVEVSEYQNYLVGEIIRYVLLFKEENGLEDYIVKLIKAMNSNKTIQELNMIRDTTYASKIVSMITKRKHKITQEELNEKVFDYMYKNLITYGYVFHAFNSKLSKSILKNGLDITKKTWEDIKIERVDKILKKYGLVDAFWDYKLFSKEGISFTSDFSSIYNYAKMSPAFLSNFIQNIDKENGKLAIYNKDLSKIKDIVLSYLDKNKIEDEDRDIILSFVEENIKEYLTEESEYVALVEKNNIEFLRGIYTSYSKYLEITEEKDPDEYTIVSYILKNQENLEDFKIKEKIKKDEVILIELPEYKAKRLNVEVKEVKEEIKEEIKEEVKEESKEKFNKTNNKIIKIDGDILFGYIKVKTSLSKIKQKYLNSLTMNHKEEPKEDDHVLSFASLNDTKKEDDHVLSFASLNDTKKEDDHILSFTSLNDTKKEDDHTLSVNSIKEKNEESEKEKMMDNFSDTDVDINSDVIEKIEKQLKEAAEKEKIISKEAILDKKEETTDIEEIKPKVIEKIKEQPKEEVIVEKVVVEKIIKKYKVQSKKVKLKRKGELTSKEKIDLAIKRAQRRKKEELELKEENENLLKAELANIEKFAMNIIDEISEKVEKEIEIVKNTKIFKDDMTKEELDAFNQNVIDKVCASNIDENVVSKKIKEYNPIEEYEKKIANMKIENIEDETIENEYDPIAAYEKQMALEKEAEANTTKAKIEELFTPIVEEEIEKVDNNQNNENSEEIVDAVKFEETNSLENSEEILDDNNNEPVVIEDVISEKEPKVIEEVEKVEELEVEEPKLEENKEDEKSIPITLLKEEVLEDKKVFDIEDTEKEESVEEIVEKPEENPTEKKYKGILFPKFAKTELKPETKKVIDKIKEKTLSFITRKEEPVESMESMEIIEPIEETENVETINTPEIIENVSEVKIEETPENVEEIENVSLEKNDKIDTLETLETLENLVIETPVIEEKVEERPKKVSKNTSSYKELEICNADNIDVSEYLKNVISKKNYEEDNVEKQEELKQKQEVIDKILEENKVEENIVEENIVEENIELENKTEDLNLDNTLECEQENLDVKDEVESLQEESVNEISEESKNEMSEEEIMKLIQEDELFMDEPQYIKKDNPYSQKYKDIIPNDMETSLIVKTSLMESFKLALKEFTRKIVTNFTTSMDEEDYENRNSKKQRIRRSPRLNEFGTYNDYKKVNKIDRVVNLMDDKSLREKRPRLTKEQKNEIIRNEKESFIENLYKEININSVNNSIYNK